MNFPGMLTWGWNQVAVEGRSVGWYVPEQTWTQTKGHCVPMDLMPGPWRNQEIMDAWQRQDEAGTVCERHISTHTHTYTQDWNTLEYLEFMPLVPKAAWIK